MIRDDVFYDKFYKTGGTFECPVEIFNELLEDARSLEDKNQKAIEYIKHQEFLQKQLFYRFKPTKYDLKKVLEILESDSNE